MDLRDFLGCYIVLRFDKFKKILFILGPTGKKLPSLIFSFLILSSLEVIGLSLIASFISIFFQGSTSFAHSIIFELLPQKLARNEDTIKYVFGCLVILSYFFKMLVSIGTMFWINTIVNQNTVQLRDCFINGYLHLGSGDYGQQSSSKYIYSVLDLTHQFSSLVLKPMLRLTSDLTIITVIFLFLIWKFGFYFITVAVLLTILVGVYYRIFSNRQQAFGKNVNKSSDSIIKLINELVWGIKEIKIFNIEQFFAKEVHKASIVNARNHNFAQLISFSPRYIFEFLFVIALTSLILISYIMNGEITSSLSSLSIIAMATLRLLPPISQISNSIVGIRFHSVTIDRLYEDVKTFRNKQDVSTNNFKVKPERFQSLSFERITFSHENSDVCIVKNASLSIKRGEVVGIIGPSGAGKSTLLNIALGFLKPNSGNIYFNGKKQKSILKKIAYDAAYIPQEPFIIDSTIAQNITLETGIEALDEQAFSFAIEKSKINNSSIDSVDEIYRLTGERGKFLSGGQKQRIVIARALYSKRNFFILDEATSALDIATENSILDAISTILPKKTILVVSHRPSIINYCDKVYKILGERLEQIK